MLKQIEGPWEKDPLKHYIRLKGWAPACDYRKKVVREVLKQDRQLRYFTFCGKGAKDVMVLNRNRIVPMSKRYGFSQVVFFERDPDHLAEALSALRGAFGFSQDFVKVVLDVETDPRAESPTVTLGGNTTAPPVNSVFAKQIDASARDEFFSLFPFDIINLDLCGHLFVPSDRFPGNILKAVRRVLDLQKGDMKVGNVNYGSLSGFTLLFTTEVGPANLSSQYVDELKACLQDNIEGSVELASLLEKSTGCKSSEDLHNDNWEDFLIYALPKILIRQVLQMDWYVDDVHGIKVYKFQRPAKDGKPEYHMLHVVMQIERQNPPYGSRLTLVEPQAQAAYYNVIRDYFENGPEVISDSSLAGLIPSLNDDIATIEANLKARRYYWTIK